MVRAARQDDEYATKGDLQNFENRISQELVEFRDEVMRRFEGMR